ncbi:hypothetical protein SI855_002856 [Clostridioides difficile]|nr:hypothetical protein [Clostridioides difficile]
MLNYSITAEISNNNKFVVLKSEMFQPEFNILLNYIDFSFSMEKEDCVEIDFNSFNDIYNDFIESDYKEHCNCIKSEDGIHNIKNLFDNIRLNILKEDTIYFLWE